jgi:hypothetical protein
MPAFCADETSAVVQPLGHYLELYKQFDTTSSSTSRSHTIKARHIHSTRYRIAHPAMAYSLYDATVSMAISALKSLSQILTRAEEHPNSTSLLTARLIDDMKPLSFQVHYATFQVQYLAAKLSGREYTEPEDDLNTYDEMQARIKQALDALKEVDRETANGLADTTTQFARSDHMMEVPVKGVVSLVNMPNIYFHVSMAYAILRKEGVPLGKRDWSRGFVSDYI